MIVNRPLGRRAGLLAASLSLVVLAPVALLAPATAAPAASAPAAGAPAAAAPALVPAAQRYGWRWADGSTSEWRTIAQSDWSDRVSSIAVILTLSPAYPRHPVYLEYYQDGRWRQETSGRTGGGGAVRLQLDPYCSSGRWCQATWRYRIRIAAAGGVGGATDYFKVSFTRS